MAITGFDHVAVPLGDVEKMLAFYRALGFEVREMGRGLAFGVHCGPNKINFHTPELWQRKEFTLRGPTAVPGCGDFCFTWDGSDDELVACLDAAGAEQIEGPVEREGGRGNGMSRYVRDPDGNLLEFIIYEQA